MIVKIICGEDSEGIDIILLYSENLINNCYFILIFLILVNFDLLLKILIFL